MKNSNINSIYTAMIVEVKNNKKEYDMNNK